MSLQFYSLKFCLPGDIGLVASFLFDQIQELDQSLFVFVSIRFVTSGQFLYRCHVKDAVSGSKRVATKTSFGLF